MKTPAPIKRAFGLHREIALAKPPEDLRGIITETGSRAQYGYCVGLLVRYGFNPAGRGVGFCGGCFDRRCRLALVVCLGLAAEWVSGSLPYGVLGILSIRFAFGLKMAVGRCAAGGTAGFAAFFENKCFLKFRTD